jgi:hypothetical protein
MPGELKEEQRKWRIRAQLCLDFSTGADSRLRILS